MFRLDYWKALNQPFYPFHDVEKKLIKNTDTPRPIYSHTTLLFILPLNSCVVKPNSTYIADDKDNDQIVTGVGQNEKLKAISPKIRLSIKLCTTIAAPILSSI